MRTETDDVLESRPFGPICCDDLRCSDRHAVVMDSFSEQMCSEVATTINSRNVHETHLNDEASELNMLR